MPTRPFTAMELDLSGDVITVAANLDYDDSSDEEVGWQRASRW